ncbi:restriction endonuclease subunit S [Dokdonia genika]|uniref:Restriction endonuclease subunit S n=1 Tax=Dokdonia genika TaxID=308113 RepID=A0ABV9LB15_9FLAO
MKTYEAYKDGDGFWIKKIPIQWSFGSLNLLVDFVMGQAPHSSSYNQDGIGEIFIKTGDFGKIRPTAKWFTTSPLVYGSKEDVFICVVGATAGKVNLGLNGTISRSIAALRPRDKVVQSYLFYFLSYNYIRLNDSSQGSAQGIINKDILSSIKLPLPSLKEQTQIAAYLDHKTHIIDALIEKKEQLIKKLQAQRQATINEAVTKGLNPNVKMKDSGIEWLGEVPEHWEVVKLKYLVDHSTEKGDGDSEFNIALENIESKTGKLIFSESKNFSGELKVFKKGNILFNKLRPYLSKVLLAPKDGECVSELLVFEAIGDIIDSNYLFQKLSSEQIISIVDSSTYGAKMPRASIDFILNLPIPLPSKEEQLQIATKIEIYKSRIYDSTKGLQNSIKKLKSYRQSIISEAVTGKIDVRDWQAPSKN